MTEQAQQSPPITDTVQQMEAERPNVDLRSIWKNDDQTFTAHNGNRCTYSLEMLKAVLGSQFSGAPQGEQAAFMAYCMHKGLDPIAKQVYFIKYDAKKPASFVTAWEVFLERAQRHPEYDGFENGIVWRIKDGDGWRMEKAGAVSYLRDGDHVIAGGWATVYRKGNRPLTVEVPLTEMSSNNTKWNTETTTMSVKTPTARCLRQQFTEALEGIYEESESKRFAMDMAAEKTTGIKSGDTVPPFDLDELMALDDTQENADADGLPEQHDDDSPFTPGEAITETADDVRQKRLLDEAEFSDAARDQEEQDG